MKKPFILLVTGISTAGKTTAFDALKTDPALSYLEFHDVDEEGIPKAGRGSWREYKSEEFIAKAKAKCQEGVSTIFVGIVPPHEVIGYRTYSKELNIHFVLLKIDQAAFEKRMKARVKKLNEEENYPEYKYENLKLALKLENQVASLKNGHTLDASRLSKKEVAAKLKDLIKSLED